MSIFRQQSAVQTEDFKAPVYEGYSVQDNGDLLAFQESLDDHLSVIESIHAIDMEEIALDRDLAEMQESGPVTESQVDDRVSEYEIATENAFKGAWEKIKSALKALWGKLKAFFASIVRFFDGIFKSSEDFVKKYEKQLRARDLNGFEFKMFKYTNIDGYDKDEAEDYEKELTAALQEIRNGVANGAYAKSDEEIQKLRDGREEALAASRAEFVGGGGSMDSEQFKKALFGYFRDQAHDSEDKKDLKVSIGEIIDTIKESGSLKKVKKSIDDIDKKFANFLKEIAALETAVANSDSSKDKAGNTSYKMQVQASNGNGGTEDKTVHHSPKQREKALNDVRVLASLFTGHREVAMTAFRAWKDAWVERNRVYKQVAISALRYKPSK